jgi:hypothetical protein
MPIPQRKGDFMPKKNETFEQTDVLETVGKSVRVKFNKTKILGMKRYANRVDLLRVLLKPEETYTLEAVDAAISDFMKGKVN